MPACLGAPAATDVNDANTLSVFREAIASYNSRNRTNLQFVNLVSATKQIVSGFKFTGIINMTNNGAAQQYNVTVWQKAGGRSIEVTRFANM
jgi:hypothetical protein